MPRILLLRCLSWDASGILTALVKWQIWWKTSKLAISYSKGRRATSVWLFSGSAFTGVTLGLYHCWGDPLASCPFYKLLQHSDEQLMVLCPVEGSSVLNSTPNLANKLPPAGKDFNIRFSAKNRKVGKFLMYYHHLYIFVSLILDWRMTKCSD